MDRLDIGQLRQEHAVALRAWQFAWSECDEWQRTSLPVRDGELGVVYEQCPGSSGRSRSQC